MEAFGSGQTSISPEFLQNIQTAVNSQGVIGQVQVIETENGPVTVLFMEEGADASNTAETGEESTTLNVNSGVESFVVNSEPSVNGQNASTQYQFVLTEDEYSNFLQNNAESINEAAALTTVPETVEEVTSIPPVISLPQVDQQELPSVSNTASILDATAIDTNTASETSTLPSANIVSDATTASETPAVSSDTYYITDTGEVVKIDSNLLADNANAVLQMQDTGNGLQVINQADFVESDETITNIETAYTSVIPEKRDDVSKPAPQSPYKFTATRLDNHLVIDAPKEEPKVLSYKTTNRQRINIMRQPTKSSPKSTIVPTTYTIDPSTKSSRSLLPASRKTSVPKGVGKNVAKPVVSYSISNPKQTIVYPSNMKSTQISSIVKTSQSKRQPENVITTVVKPQVLKKPGTIQKGYTKQIVNKIPASRMSSGQHDRQRTIILPKFASQVVPKQAANVSNDQSDLLLTAMEEASVPQQVSAVHNYSNKQIVSPNPIVVRDPSTAFIKEQNKPRTIIRDSQGVYKPASVSVETSKEQNELPSMPVLETATSEMGNIEMEIDNTPTTNIKSVASTSGEKTPIEYGIPGKQAIEFAPDEQSADSVYDQSAVESALVEPVVKTSLEEQLRDSISGTPLAESEPDKPVVESVSELMEVDDHGNEKLEESLTLDDEKEDTRPMTPVASTSMQTVLPPVHTEKEILDTNDNKDKGTQLTDIPDDGLKSIDVPDSDVTIQLFADGTLVTKDKAGTNYSTVKLEDLGLNMSMLESNTDIELLIVQGDGKEVRATINTSKHVNPVTKPVIPGGEEAVSSNPDATAKQPLSAGDRQGEEKEVSLPLNEARPYKCSMCPRTFKFYRTFKCHEIVHSKAVTFTCHLCKRLFAREVNLQSHLELHKKKAALKPEVNEKAKPKACYDCGKIFESESKMKRHYQAMHESKPRFPCPICGNLFKSLLVLQKHSKVHVGPFNCPHCSTEFQEREQYDSHIQEEHAELMHTCDDCGMILPSKLAFAMHVVFQHKEKSTHPAMKRKECIICERRFDNMESIERHMVIHSSEKSLECPKCSESFKLMWQLEKHIRDIHDNDVEFTCSNCKETFPKKLKLDLHMQLFHTGPYQCHVCYEEFPERIPLEEHQFTNHDGGFKCSKCGEKFETSLKLKHHLSNDHVSKAFLCEACGAGFEHKPALRTHLMERHFKGERLDMLKQYPGMKSVNTEVICDFCGEYFGARTSYKQHLRDVHFGGDSVMMLEYFPSFAKIPDPPVPVTCDHCGKEFRGLVHLNKHLRSHMRGRKKTRIADKDEELESGDDVDGEEEEDSVDFTNIEPREMEKDYKCKKCNALFSRKAALEKHMALRHKKDPLKEALRNIEKEELERAELEEKQGVTPLKGKKGSATKVKNSNIDTSDELSKTKENDLEDESVNADSPGNTKFTKQHVCDICEKKFKTGSQLKTHLKRIHHDKDKMQDMNELDEAKGFSIKRLLCLTCNKQFSKSRYLRRHLRTVHKVFKVSREQDGSRVFHCEVCSQTFDNTGNLNRHFEARHSEKAKSLKKKKKKVESDESSDSFDEENAGDGTDDITSFLGMNFNLAKTSSCNIESVKKKQHKCNICGKAFSREATLKKHIAFHDAEESEDIESMEGDDYTGLQPALYPCKSCESTYFTALGLIHHNRNKHIHVDEESVLADILEIDEKNKAESPKKKTEKDLRRSVKRKAESPKISSPITDQLKKKMKMDEDGVVYPTLKGLNNHKKDAHSNALKVESPQKPIKFSHSGRIITHSKKVMEQIQCDQCSKTFMKEQYLQMHVARVHLRDTESSFSCDICDKTFDLKSKLSQHKKMKHNIVTPAAENSSTQHKCEVCGDKLKSLSDFKQHMNDMHTDVKAESLDCEVCQQNFGTQKSLDIHMRKHTGEKPYKCCLCSNRFISKYRLECHMKKLHLKQWQKKVSCKICLALFDSKTEMLRHKEVHRNPSSVQKIDRRKLVPHKCSVCDKSFRWKRTLNAHFATHRNDFDAFTCGVCNKVFPDKASIKDHMLVHKKPGDTPAATKSITDTHACRSCDRTFTKASGLRLHELSAHSAAPAPILHKCGICDRSFPKKSGLRMHEVTHTGKLQKVELLSCNICQENFHSKESLLEHMLSHTSIMPFKCDVCAVSFKHAYSLKAHKLIHDMEEASDLSSSKSGKMKNAKDDEKKYSISDKSMDKVKRSKCKKQFTSLAMLRNHSRKVHKTKVALGAGLIKRRVETRTLSSDSIEKKKKTENLKRNIICRMCNKSFSKAEQLKAHMDKAHSKKAIDKSTEKMSLSSKKIEVSKERDSATKQKFPARHECPNCKKRFTQRYNLRLHLMKAHNATMEKLPSKLNSARKKWLYCKECASLFWSQSQYNLHNKRYHFDQAAKDLDKYVKSLSDNDVKVEPNEDSETGSAVKFETIQHKCEFCTSIFLTKKLFDEHMLKDHPENAEEYGIVPSETDVSKPSIELVNDSEDLMGNLISVGLCDVENCKKLSSLPVVSLKRYRGNETLISVRKEDADIDKQECDQKHGKQCDDLRDIGEVSKELSDDLDAGDITEIKVTQNAAESSEENIDHDDNEVEEDFKELPSGEAMNVDDQALVESDDDKKSDSNIGLLDLDLEENLESEVCTTYQEDSDIIVSEKNTDEDEMNIDNIKDRDEENDPNAKSVENDEDMLTKLEVNKEKESLILDEIQDESENDDNDVVEESNYEINYHETKLIQPSQIDNAAEFIKTEQIRSVTNENDMSIKSEESENKMQIDDASQSDPIEDQIDTGTTNLANSEEPKVYMEEKITNSPVSEYTELTSEDNLAGVPEAEENT